MAKAQSTGTFSFLFTDLEASTRHWEEAKEAMSAALMRHDALLRQAIAAHGGHVFKTMGDAFCAAFGTPHEALAAALDGQRAMAAERWSVFSPQLEDMRVRMGIHHGFAEARDGDYFGPALNRTARLMAVGHGGQVLLSLAAEQLVRDYLPTGVTLVDRGEHHLRDLHFSENIWQVVAADLRHIDTPLGDAHAGRPGLERWLNLFPAVHTHEDVVVSGSSEISPTRPAPTSPAPGSRSAARPSAQAVQPQQPAKTASPSSAARTKRTTSPKSAGSTRPASASSRATVHPEAKPTASAKPSPTKPGVRPAAGAAAKGHNVVTELSEAISTAKSAVDWLTDKLSEAATGLVEGGSVAGQSGRAAAKPTAAKSRTTKSPKPTVAKSAAAKPKAAKPATAKARTTKADHPSTAKPTAAKSRTTRPAGPAAAKATASKPAAAKSAKAQSEADEPAPDGPASLLDKLIERLGG